jgi:hypothetical protein
MKFDTHIENEMPNTKILKPEVLAQNKMAATATAILENQQNALTRPFLNRF